MTFHLRLVQIQEGIPSPVCKDFASHVPGEIPAPPGSQDQPHPLQEHVRVARSPPIMEVILKVIGASVVAQSLNTEHSQEARVSLLPKDLAAALALSITASLITAPAAAQ
jgi:hypothetical protein